MPPVTLAHSQEEFIVVLTVDVNKKEVISNIAPASPHRYVKELIDHLKINQESPLKDSYTVRIILHKITELQSRYSVPTKFVGTGATTYRILDDSFMLGQERLLIEEEKKRVEWCPIIHLATCDLLTEEAKKYIKGLPRYIKIIDSSIWNYFYCFEYAYKEPEKRRLSSIVSDIIHNYDEKLYELAITHEYADFNARLVCESFIADSQGHGQHVVPFLYHSEWEMRRKIHSWINKDLKKDLPAFSIIDGSAEINDKLAAIRSKKWRILLIDDKIGSGEKGFLSLSTANSVNFSYKTKDNIVLDRLRLLFGTSFVTNDSQNKEANIYLKAVASIEEAKEELCKYKFEIILLDYLLETENGRRQYGHELLDSIRTKVSSPIYYKVGPHKKLFVMFISAFTAAVNERLLAEGLHRNETFWHIAEGACPTNTPYLFLYNLLHMMDMRMSDMGILKLDLSAILSQLHDIFNEGNIRKKANERFHEILSLLYHYKNMLQDVDYESNENIFETKGSVLVTDYLSEHPFLGALLEHITQLVYLTAFGTIRQWPEMWEEYHYVRTCARADAANETEVEKLNSIEKYIMNLKNGAVQ